MAEVDAVFRDRWRTLLSVDDLVAGLVARLEQEQLLDTTYILYTRCHTAQWAKSGVFVQWVYY